MTLPIIFGRAARAEFDKDYDWYERQRAGLGEDFSTEVHATLARIAATLAMHQCIYKDVRRGVVRRFPYSVLYRIKSNQVRVLAVFHSSRDPAIWQARA